MAKAQPIDLAELFGVPAVSYEQLEADLADAEKRREEFIRSADIAVAQYDGAIHLLKTQMQRALDEAAAREEKRKAEAAEAELKAQAVPEPGPVQARSVLVPVLAPNPETVEAALDRVPSEVVQMVPRRASDRAARDAAKDEQLVQEG